MKIKKDLLKNSLTVVSPGLSTNDAIEQGSSFCFMNGGVVTYNDEISIYHPVPELEELQGAVSASEFLGFINKAKTDEINITVESNEILLKSSRSKAAFVMEAEVTLPVDELGEVEDWKKLPENFGAAITFAMGCCTNDMVKPVLTCVSVDGKFVEASDNFRIVRYEMKSKVKGNPFLIPAKVCRNVAKLNPIQFSEGEGWIHFKNANNTVISCRTFEEEFPNISAFLNVEGDSLKFPKKINDILDRASIFSKRANELDETIELKINGGKLMIKSSSEAGRFEESCKIEFEGEPIEFSMTPYLLRDVMKETNVGILNGNKLLFKGEDWTYMSLTR